MKSLYTFITETLSDNSILYVAGLHKFCRVALNQQRLKSVVDQYNISPNDIKPGTIRWAKDCFPNLIPDSEEVVPRSQWDLWGVSGQSENQLMHPHYDKVGQFVNTHPQRKHDILLVMECSNSKPYNTDAPKIQWMRLFDNYVDFGNAAYGIVPYVYCNLYPYRWDEWDHYSEGQYGGWAYRQVSIVNFINYVEAWGYKHVVVFMQNPWPQGFLTEIKEKNIRGWGEKMTIITTKDWLDEEFKKSPFDSLGMFITRLLGLPSAKAATAKVLQKVLKDLGHDKEASEMQQIYNILDKVKEGPERKKKIKELGFVNYSGPVYCEKIFGKSVDKDYAAVVKESKINQSDFKNTLDKIEKMISDTDIEKIKEEPINDTFGKGIDEDPEALYNMYVWCWPLLKILHLANDKKGLPFENLQETYENLKKFMQEQKDWTCINDYCFVHQPTIDKLGWNKTQLKDNLLKIHFIEPYISRQSVETMVVKKIRSLK